MTEKKPTMEDGFLIIDREDEGIEPRYLVEHYVAGEVRSAKTFATSLDIAYALGDWKDETRPNVGLSEEDAFALFDFVDWRLFGWNIALSSNNKRGVHDGRTQATKVADRLLRDVIFNRPDFDDYIAALIRGEDPADQWPEPFHEFVRFCISHRCPREINEPFSAYGIEMRTEEQGMPPWPDFLRKYDKTATLLDMPNLPPPSEEYKAFESRRRA